MSHVFFSFHDYMKYAHFVQIGLYECIPKFPVQEVKRSLLVLWLETLYTTQGMNV